MHSVDISPLYGIANDTISTLAQALAAAVAAWIMVAFHRWITPWIGAQLETKAANDLNTALQNGVAIAMTRLEAWENIHSDIQVRGMVQSWAAQYAIDHAPGAVDRFGLNPSQLATKALAYIPMPRTGADTTGATLKREPVAVAPLPATS